MARHFPEPPPAKTRADEGDWVLLHRVVLPPGQRATAAPPETQDVALEMRVKGFLLGGPAGLGETVTARTLSGRVVSGVLVAVDPVIPHTFGAPVPELLAVGPELRTRLRGRVGFGKTGTSSGVVPGRADPGPARPVPGSRP